MISGIWLIVLGIAIVLFGICAWVGITQAEVSAYQSAAQSDGGSTALVPSLQATLIDIDGKVIVPDGVPVWEATLHSYHLWDICINPGPIGTRDGYRWYVLDKVGTPITEEEMAKILGQFYGG